MTTAATIPFVENDGHSRPYPTHGVQPIVLPPKVREVAPEETRAIVDDQVHTGPQAAHASVLPSWQAWLLISWFMGVLILGLWVVRRSRFVRRLVQQADLAERQMVETLDECRLRLRVRQPVELRVSGDAAAPAVGEEASGYSSTLIDIAERVFRRPVPGLAFIGVAESGRALAGRIRHIMRRPYPVSARLGVAGFVCVMVAAATLLPMAAAEPPAASVGLGNAGRSATTEPAEDTGDVRGSQPGGPAGEAQSLGHVRAEKSEREVSRLDAYIDAVEAGDVWAVRRRLAEEPDLVSASVRRVTKGTMWSPALHLAAKRGQLELVELLLSKGADPNRADAYYRTGPLHWAASHAAHPGRREMARLLLDAGADIDTRDKAGR